MTLSYNIEILEDRTLSIKTTDISDSNHISADALMAQFDEPMGGKVDIKKNPDAKAHVHLHGRHHAHAGGYKH